MSIQILGVSPTHDDGYEFPATSSVWPSLWSYVAYVCCDILSEKEIEDGLANNGNEYSKTKSLQMLDRLESAERDGLLNSFEQEHQRYVRELEKDAVFVPCPACADGKPHKGAKRMPNGTCAWCGGAGKLAKPPLPEFNSDWVALFLRFLQFCGGFQVR